MKHIPGLNGIRAIAVFLVIIAHRFPGDHIFITFPLGNIGVDVFFVLSGFLISRILFQQLQIIETTDKTRWQVVKNFILRRMIRIFPIYYLTLLFLYLTSGIIGNYFEENILWYVFYGANYLNFFENRWFGSLAHLWSLSVEEQFYLIWPFLIFFVFRKRLSVLLTLAIVVGTIYPFFFSGITKVLTIGCINAFGIGALLAYVEIVKPQYKNKLLTTLNYLFFPVLLLTIFNFTYTAIPYFSIRLATSIMTVTVIAHCRYHPNNKIVVHVLENKVLYFIGMISYGIYLYHNLVPRYWRFALRELGFETPGTRYEFSYIEFFLQTALIILISYLSWIWIEKPVLKLKKYVKY